MFSRLKQAYDALFTQASVPGTQVVHAASAVQSPPVARAACSVAVTDSSQSVCSLVAEGVMIRGDMEVMNGIKIDGRVEGSIRVNEGRFVLTGFVRGDVYSETAFINGTIEGDVYATRIILGPLGRVKGAVSYAQMHWREGATIEGKVRKVSAEEMVQGVADTAHIDPVVVSRVRTPAPKPRKRVPQKHAQQATA